MNANKLHTVERIIRSIYQWKYFFSDIEEELLSWLNIINGIWASNWINFSEILEGNVRFFKWYDPEKVKKLLKDMRKLSGPHDAKYMEWGNWFDKNRADKEYAQSNKELFHWTSKKNQRRIYWIIYLSLLIKWNSAFAFWEKKDILDIIYHKENIWN